ncbi:hypothetical protein V6N13_079924 [Hibiscus sabdariffa]|uniref:Uncharacterized protein n=1 Tax=Hibiscus sabdariffa TaxID=183260 RepID=A0ABR2RTK2_9ROSI
MYPQKHGFCSFSLEQQVADGGAPDMNAHRVKAVRDYMSLPPPFEFRPKTSSPPPVPPHIRQQRKPSPSSVFLHKKATMLIETVFCESVWDMSWGHNL